MKKHLLTFLKIIILLCAVVVLVFSAYKLYGYNKERKDDEKLAEKVVLEAPLKELAPISVDFEKLKQESDDVIAWLYCEGTPINYPIVQAEDNSFYLYRKTDGKYGVSGTLFADCANKGDFSDNNTVVYGHNMYNDTMFGILPKFARQEFFEEHPVMYLLTPEGDYKVELAFGVTVNAASEIYQLPLEDDCKETVMGRLLEKSTFASGYVFSDKDRFLTLSTCSYAYDNARYVLVGVLKDL